MWKRSRAPRKQTDKHPGVIRGVSLLMETLGKSAHLIGFSDYQPYAEMLATRQQSVVAVAVEARY